VKYITAALLMLSSFIFVNCSCNCGQEDIDLKIHMKYGYADEVNTFENYFKKDLVMDGFADTTFSFTAEQKNAILSMANEVNFFDMPEVIESTVNYEQNPSPGQQMLRIKFDKWDHTVKWQPPIGDSKLEQDIKKLSYFIINIIINSPEYKALPAPSGGYL
jgi:hypothetical protein